MPTTKSCVAAVFVCVLLGASLLLAVTNISRHVNRVRVVNARNRTSSPIVTAYANRTLEVNVQNQTSSPVVTSYENRTLDVKAQNRTSNPIVTENANQTLEVNVQNQTSNPIITENANQTLAVKVQNQTSQPIVTEIGAPTSPNAKPLTLLELYRRWPDNTIPFVLSWKFEYAETRTIRRALDQIQAVSCFRFVRRTNQTDFVFIGKLDGCWSYVGRMGGKQPLSLGEACLVESVIVHEAMHSLGFRHEHQRPDRDDFVQILWSNIKVGEKRQFRKHDEYTIGMWTPYDYDSIMHYTTNTFGKLNPTTGLQIDTMRFKRTVPGGVQQNGRLTYTDIWRLLQLGNCPRVYWTMLESYGPGECDEDDYYDD